MPFYIDADGNLSKGRSEIEKLHSDWLGSGLYKGSHTVIRVRAVRFLKPDVAVCDGTWEDSGMHSPDGKELSPMKGVWSDTVVKKDGKWWAVTVHASAPAPTTGQ